MDIEILLDTKEVTPDKLPLVSKVFQDWYREGSEIRYNKTSFNNLIVLEGEHRYLVDLGDADAITAFRNLHARIHRLGVKVFIHFLH